MSDCADEESSREFELLDAVFLSGGSWELPMCVAGFALPMSILVAATTFDGRDRTNPRAIAFHSMFL